MENKNQMTGSPATEIVGATETTEELNYIALRLRDFSDTYKVSEEVEKELREARDSLRKARHLLEGHK